MNFKSKAYLGLSILLLCSCDVLKKDKEEIKKVSHDLIDEAIDSNTNDDSSIMHH